MIRIKLIGKVSNICKIYDDYIKFNIVIGKHQSDRIPVVLRKNSFNDNYIKSGKVIAAEGGFRTIDERLVIFIKKYELLQIATNCKSILLADINSIEDLDVLNSKSGLVSSIVCLKENELSEIELPLLVNSKKKNCALIFEGKYQEKPQIMADIKVNRYGNLSLKLAKFLEDKIV